MEQPDAEPFADIIETFREIAERGRVPHPTAAAVAEAAPERASTAAPEPSDEVLPTAAPADRHPLGTMDRRPGRSLRYAAAGLALVAGTGLVAQLLAGGGSDPTASRPEPERPASPTAEQEYADVLAAITAANDLADLTSAAEAASAAAHRVPPRAVATGGEGPRRQRLREARLASLRAFGALDAVTAATALGRFAPALGRIHRAATSVTSGQRRAGVADPTLDPAPAVDAVVRILAPLALDALAERTTRLLDDAGAADLTAELRAVAGRAGEARPVAADIVTALEAVGGHQPLQARAGGLAGTIAGLVRLRALDGDHLGRWTPLRGALTTDLSRAGLDTEPVARIDRLVATARQRLVAWAATRELARGTAKAAIASYRSEMAAALDRFRAAQAALPELVVTEPGSAALSTQVEEGLGAVQRAWAAARGTGPVPPELTRAHTHLLVGLARLRRLAAAAGLVTLRAEACGGCHLGDLPAWARYAASRRAADSLAALRGDWESAVERVAAGAVDRPVARPPRPEV